MMAGMSQPAAAPVVVRPARPEDRAAWSRLFRAYREFYELAQDDAVGDRVWSWILEESHEVGALLAELDGEVVGLAHHRFFARPSAGGVGLHLDDLFTVPEVRGRGVGRALITRLTEIARDHGCDKVRWITAADNTTAHRLYDDVAERTGWVTYDLTP